METPEEKMTMAERIRAYDPNATDAAVAAALGVKRYQVRSARGKLPKKPPRAEQRKGDPVFAYLLFRGAMSRALVALRKTETRRPIAPHNTLLCFRHDVTGRSHTDGMIEPGTRYPWVFDQQAWKNAEFVEDARVGAGLVVVFKPEMLPAKERKRSSVLLMPRVRHGHIVLARETSAVVRFTGGGTGHVVYRSDLQSRVFTNNVLSTDADSIHQMEDGWEPEAKWTPGVHMPNWAVRTMRELTLPTIAQRLGDLTEKQVIAEGFPLQVGDPERSDTAASPFAHFEAYWLKIHEEPLDPTRWVWAYRGMKPTETRP